MSLTLKPLSRSVAIVAAFAVAPAVHAQTFGSTAVTANDRASAQTAIPAARLADEAQRAQERAALEPVGAHFGSFTLYPHLVAGVTYDDNIYAIEAKTDDGVARLAPSFELEGDFGITSLTVRGTGDLYRYFDRTREDRNNWTIGSTANAEVAPKTILYASAGYNYQHEDRGDPNASYTDIEPTVYELTEASLGFSRDLARLRAGLDMSFRQFNYHDNIQVDGNPINHDDRDRDMWRIGGRLGFEFSPGYLLCTRLAYEKVDYRLPLNDAGFNRDSEGLRATLGLGVELSSVLQGELFAGYLRRSYEDSRFDTFGGSAFGASLNWTPTPLTRVRLNADRAVQETIASRYRGYLSTSFAVDVEHELLREVTLSVALRYSDDDYLRATLPNAGPRTDKNYGANIGVKYMLNRNLFTSLDYGWSKRTTSSTQQGIEFERNKVSVSLGLQL